MFKNCYYDTKKSTIHLFEQVKGEKETYHNEIPWTPYLYMPSKKSDIKTIYGKSVHKKEFDTFFDYHAFQKSHDAVHLYENKAKFETQFLAERYHGIPDEEIEVPSLKTYYIDIEVAAPEGFPDPKIAQDPITLISVRNSENNRTVTFGYNPFDGSKYTGNLEGVTYVHCDYESDLLRKFLGFMEKYPCDVISGWYIWQFDLPYIINRCMVIWGDQEGRKQYSKMSPLKVVHTWKQKLSDDMNIDMGGVTILDYYNIYRWYGQKLPRYTLEYVSQEELGEGKLDYSQYKNLNDLMEKDWNLYTDYNVVDCERVHDLENKLGYIRGVQALSLLCKSPMKFYNAQTQLIEGLMLTYYRRNNLCAPHFFGGKQEDFKAAHVKDPQAGLWKWIVDVDITSSYPSHIITLNMSLETFMGKISGMPEYQVVKNVARKEFGEFKMLKKDGDWKVITMDKDKLHKFNLALEKGLIAIAPNGSIFSTQKEGVIAKVERLVFFKRKEVKTKRDEYGRKADESEGDEKELYKDRYKELDSLQGAIKIMMNAFFGILSVPYSRYFNVHIASAITAGGRHTIKKGEEFCNELLNNPTEDLMNILKRMSDGKIIDPGINETPVDYVKYIDTDSLFVGIGEWIDDMKYGDIFLSIPDEEKIKWIRKISEEMEAYIDDRIFKEVQLRDYNCQVHDFKIGFKQEIIAKTALFVKKKKYSYHLVDKEGFPKDELKTTGLEIVRSDSSEAIRPRLKKVMEMIVKQDSEENISKIIRRYTNELRKMTPSELAANVGINNINKYLSEDGRAIKGAPWHVKGVYNYRTLLDHLELRTKYDDIYDGTKSKVIYVKKNPFEIDTITFNEWPTEFEEVIQFDYNTMIEKFFINKIRTLLEPLEKEHIIDHDDSKLSVFF